MGITSELLERHCCLAMTVIANHLNDCKIFEANNLDMEVIPSMLFVTVNLYDKYANRRELRGCIGSPIDGNYKESFSKLVMKAAFKDFRFEGIKKHELSKLEVTISALDKFEANRKFDDWIIGTHGIIMKYKDRSNNREYSALFLPEVMVEHNMNKKEALLALLEKSGYRFNNQNYKENEIDKMKQDISITRFITVKHSLLYDDFLKLVKQSKYNIEEI